MFRGYLSIRHTLINQLIDQTKEIRYFRISNFFGPNNRTVKSERTIFGMLLFLFTHRDVIYCI